MSDETTPASQPVETTDDGQPWYLRPSEETPEPAEQTTEQQQFLDWSQAEIRRLSRELATVTHELDLARAELERIGAQTFEFELQYVAHWENDKPNWTNAKQAHVFAANGDEAAEKVKSIAGFVNPHGAWAVRVISVREIRR